MRRFIIGAIGLIASVIAIFVFVTGKQSIVDLSGKPMPNIYGDWELAFSFDRCDNPDMSLSRTTIIYDVKISKKEKLIEFEGKKIKEFGLSGDTIYYRPSAKHNLTIHSKYFNGHLCGKSFLVGSDKNEIRGEVDINLAEGHTVYDGIYKGGSKNDCDGSLRLWRK